MNNQNQRILLIELRPMATMSEETILRPKIDKKNI